MVLASAGSPACSMQAVQCECAQSGLTIVASGQVESLSGSGVACGGAKIRCGGPDFTLRAGCDSYCVTPVSAGECKLDLTLKSGATQSRTFTFRYVSGGAYPTRASTDSRASRDS